MTARVTVKTVRFTQPFRLGGIDDVQAPGVYEVTVEEEQASGMANQGWHRIATTIAIPRDGTMHGRRVDPVDLDASLLRDKGLAVLPTSET